MKYQKDEKINILEWPTMSPDINLIKDMKNGFQYCLQRHTTQKFA